MTTLSTTRSNGGAKTKPKPPKPTPRQIPEKFTYQLATYSAELRDQGWFIAKSTPAFVGQKPEWIGPFKSIENAAFAIARRLATEMADRHTRMTEQYGLDSSHTLWGLQHTTVP